MKNTKVKQMKMLEKENQQLKKRVSILNEELNHISTGTAGTATSPALTPNSPMRSRGHTLSQDSALQHFGYKSGTGDSRSNISGMSYRSPANHQRGCSTSQRTNTMPLTRMTQHAEYNASKDELNTVRLSGKAHKLYEI